MLNIGWNHFHNNYKLPNDQSPLLRDPRFQKFINGSVYAIGILGVSATIPQILKIWVEREAEGVSLVTWIGFTISACFWLAYGLIHRDKAIVLSSSCALVADLMIVTGVFFVSS